jgi:hypothetical protein
MRKNRTILIILISATVFLSSCKKVIQLDLNTSVPQLVIQGNVYDQPGPYSVKISRTVNFDLPNIFPPVTNAKVTMKDNTGLSEELSQVTDGTYVTTSLEGVIGRTYTLSVIVDGKTYVASSTMPEAVLIDTIYMKKSIFGNTKMIALDFMNFPNKEKYYHFVHFINGVQDPGFSIFNDNTNQEVRISYSFMNPANATPKLVNGDKIEVWLECIDKGVYEYYRTANRDGGRSASPANPVSNISNGALGYFSACSVRKGVFIYHL